MSFLCNIGLHKWDGCTCTRCGATRDKGHKWDGCKCTRCGKERHKWDGCKCTRCGATRDEEHRWNGCKCIMCGQEQHDYRQDKCIRCGKANWTNCTHRNYDILEGGLGACAACQGSILRRRCKDCGYEWESHYCP